MWRAAFIILVDIAKLSFIEALLVHVPWSVLDACHATAWPACCAVKHLDYCLCDRGTMVSHYHFHLNFYYYEWIELFCCSYVWKPYFLPSYHFYIGPLDFAYNGICHAENFYVVSYISLMMWNFLLFLKAFSILRLLKDSSIVEIG